MAAQPTLRRQKWVAVCRGLAIDDVSRRFRDEHHATLLAVNRLGHTFINPVPDFQLMADDEALVVAEDLGELKPVHRFTGPIDETTKQAPTTSSSPS